MSAPLENVAASAAAAAAAAAASLPVTETAEMKARWKKGRRGGKRRRTDGGETAEDEKPFCEKKCRLFIPLFSRAVQEKK